MLKWVNMSISITISLDLYLDIQGNHLKLRKIFITFVMIEGNKFGISTHVMSQLEAKLRQKFQTKYKLFK